MIKRVYLSSLWIAAGLLAFLLPFTSFPLVARLTGSQMVAPLSFLPMLALLIFWLVPYLLRCGKLAPQSIPLLGFGTVGLISAAAAFFIPFPAYKGVTLLRSEVKALGTLVIGICFYLVIAGWATRPGRIRFLLRWVNWGGVLFLGWSFFQALVFFRMKYYPQWMWNFQGSVVTSLLLYGPRVNGFAYEPSWLSHQLNMLYLPFWLAASVSGFTAHRFRIWKIHFEHLLLLGGIGVLVLSVSRIGWLTFLMEVAFLLLVGNVWLVRRVQRRLFQNRTAVSSGAETRLAVSAVSSGAETRLAVSAADARTRLLRRVFIAASIVVLILVYTGLLVGTGFALSKIDPRMARIFDFSVIKEQSFFHWANDNVFAERIVFWQAGWEVFNDYPLLGVGLGNAGYFFAQKLSAFSTALTEVRTLLYQSTVLPNIKSLWVRLLAETGIVGFGLFLSWGYVLWRSAQFLRSRGDGLFKMVGLAGSFVLVGFLIEGFSVDTFALPYFWFSFGLITTACEFARQCPADWTEAKEDRPGSEQLPGGRNE